MRRRTIPSRKYYAPGEPFSMADGAWTVVESRFLENDRNHFAVIIENDDSDQTPDV